MLPGKLSAGKQALKFAKALAVAAIFENEDAVISWLRGYIMESLAPVSPGHLSAAIRNDTDFWKKLPEGKKRLVQRLAGTDMVRETFNKYANMINSETFLQWMKEDRPDLASCVINWPDDRAIKWLERGLEQVKKSFTDAMGPTA